MTTFSIIFWVIIATIIVLHYCNRLEYAICHVVCNIIRKGHGETVSKWNYEEFKKEIREAEYNRKLRRLKEKYNFA